MTGIIIKGVGGFYDIKPAAFSVQNENERQEDISAIIRARSRGVFRHQKIKPMVGDHVEVLLGQNEAVINRILPRKNAFIRPPVANVELAVLVFAMTQPKPDLLLLDKLLVAAEYHLVRPIICLTKTDLTDEAGFDALCAIYEETGYPVLKMNNQSGDDLEKLEKMLSGKTAFLAGPSGVGKSTLANRLCEQEIMETGDLSQKLQRGRHTTRHVAFLTLKCGGYLLDTPGFSSLTPETGLTADALADCFPEFPEKTCKFHSCTHRSEPGCVIKSALAEGKIHPSRYQHYLTLYDAIEHQKNNR